MKHILNFFTNGDLIDFLLYEIKFLMFILFLLNLIIILNTFCLL